MVLGPYWFPEAEDPIHSILTISYPTFFKKDDATTRTTTTTTTTTSTKTARNYVIEKKELLQNYQPLLFNDVNKEEASISTTTTKKPENQMKNTKSLIMAAGHHRFNLVDPELHRKCCSIHEEIRFGTVQLIPAFTICNQNHVWLFCPDYTPYHIHKYEQFVSDHEMVRNCCTKYREILSFDNTKNQNQDPPIIYGLSTCKRLNFWQYCPKIEFDTEVLESYEQGTHFSTSTSISTQIPTKDSTSASTTTEFPMTPDDEDKDLLEIKENTRSKSDPEEKLVFGSCAQKSKRRLSSNWMCVMNVLGSTDHDEMENEQKQLVFGRCKRKSPTKWNCDMDIMIDEEDEKDL